MFCPPRLVKLPAEFFAYIRRKIHTHQKVLKFFQAGEVITRHPTF